MLHLNIPAFKNLILNKSSSYFEHLRKFHLYKSQLFNQIQAIF